MECKDTQILSWDKDCYGEKKEKIIAEFFLTPPSLFQANTRTKKSGCCGELKIVFASVRTLRYKIKKTKVHSFWI